MMCLLMCRPTLPHLQPAIQLSRQNLWPNCLLKSKIFTASAESFSSLRPWVRPRWGYTTTWLTLRSVASARPGPLFSAGTAKQTAWCSVSTVSEVFSDRTMTLTHFLSWLWAFFPNSAQDGDIACLNKKKKKSDRDPISLWKTHVND